jgi:hypothetical protein
VEALRSFKGFRKEDRIAGILEWMFHIAER